MTLTTMPPMKECRIMCPFMPSKNGKIYAIGGQFSGPCECFDIKTDVWSKLPTYSEFLPENDLQTFSLLTLN